MTESQRPVPVLTLRQQEILGLLFMGATDAKLAQVMRCSRQRIYRHLGQLKRQLGCQHRRDLITWIRTVPRTAGVPQVAGYDPSLAALAKTLE
jgi:DNA-binding CsgD family transcriptional regulator